MFFHYLRVARRYGFSRRRIFLPERVSCGTLAQMVL